MFVFHKEKARIDTLGPDISGLTEATSPWPNNNSSRAKIPKTANFPLLGVFIGVAYYSILCTCGMIPFRNRSLINLRWQQNS